MPAVTAVENIVIKGLAPRQAEALAHTALGRTAKETARIMLISPRTVEMHLHLAQDHLGARNRLHLITQAVASGVMSFRESAAIALLLVTLSLVSVPAGDDLIRLPARSLRARTRQDGEA